MREYDFNNVEIVSFVLVSRQKIWVLMPILNPLGLILFVMFVMNNADRNSVAHKCLIEWHYENHWYFIFLDLITATWVVCRAQWFQWVATDQGFSLLHAFCCIFLSKWIHWTGSKEWHKNSLWKAWSLLQVCDSIHYLPLNALHVEITLFKKIMCSASQVHIVVCKAIHVHLFVSACRFMCYWRLFP